MSKNCPFNLQQILEILKDNNVIITDKELAELISHDILAGTSYFKQLKKRGRVLGEDAIHNRRLYEDLYYAEYYKREYLKLIQNEQEADNDA